MKTIHIGDIKVGKRFRKELGNVHELAQSIEKVGLMHPIVVDKDNQLISGLRRIWAYKMMKRNEIPVTVLDLDNILEGEYEENVTRKDFSPSEMVAIKHAIEDREEEEAKERQGRPGEERSEKLSEHEKGRAADKIAKAVGTSRHTLKKAEEIVKAAKADPKKHGKLQEEMDKTGKVDPVHKKLKEAERAEAAKAAPKYGTIVITPDWESAAERRKLVQIPVWEWADKDCHLYLWVPNEYIPKALDLLKDWEFEYKTILTWVKPRMNFGEFFRNSTEQVIFAMRGKDGTRVHDIPTHFEVPETPGRKPEEFYKIVEKASPGPYIDALGKEPREGWVYNKLAAK